jgi:hypothetical protein
LAGWAQDESASALNVRRFWIRAVPFREYSPRMHLHPPRSLIMLLAILALCAQTSLLGAGHASEPQADQSGPPVTIIFRALSPDSQPVLDIKPEELMLKVQGKVREITSLKLLHFSGEPVAVAKAAVSSMPEPFVTNGTSHLARSTLLIVDDESIAVGNERTVKDALNAFLAIAAPGDRVGIITLPRGGGNVSPTTDRDKVKAVIDRLVGRAPRNEAASDALCRTALTLDALRGVIESYYWESLTTMVYFSGGLSPAVTAQGSARMGQSSGVCDLRREVYLETAGAALQAPVDFYVGYVPDETATSAAATSDQRSGLEYLSALTGNEMLRVGGTSRSQMERLARATSAYYVLTFDPANSERNNSNFRVELKTTRDRTDIRAKPDVAITRGGPRTGAAKGATARDMLRVGSSFREMPLRALTYIGRDTGDKLKILAHFEAVEPGTVLTSAAVGLYDDKGKLTANAVLQGKELTGGSVLSAVTAKPGTYRLRAAAVDSTGRRGAVDMEVKAELTAAGPVTLGSLMLFSQDRGFAPTLAFGEENIAVGYVEAYGVPKGANVSARFELGTTRGGQAFISVPATIPPSKVEDFRVVSADVPIGAIPPGDFDFRVVVSVDGKQVGTLSRTLRKVLK